MLDHEVGIDEIEGSVLKRERLAEVGDHEAVERAVLATSISVKVDADQLGDASAEGGQPCPSPAARVEHAGIRTERGFEKPDLNLDV
jgi:hypothetical protein